MTTIERPTTDTLIHVREVLTRCGISRATLYTYIRQGTFPQPLKLPGGKAVRWRETEIQAWIDGLPRSVGDLG